MKKVQIAVRDFALPVPRIGSIETHSGYGALPQVGQEIHAKIQQQRLLDHPGYEPEVMVRHSFHSSPYEFVVSGRMDGLFRGETHIIEEIKTAYQLDDLKNKINGNWNHPYCLQLQTYGYIHYKQTHLFPKLVLHLVSARGHGAFDIEVPFEIATFEAWLIKRLIELTDEEKKREARTKRRRKMGLTFPFPFEQPRPSQMELIELVQEKLKTDDTLLIQAPTGLGKTVGVLYPTLQEALSRGQQVIYVTPKNSQHMVAEEAARSFQRAKASVKTLTLRAKSKVCFKEEPICNPEHCEYASGHYEKMAHHQVVDQLAKNKNLSSKKIQKLAETFQVCPFELSLEAIERADLVICDYNYVFSPRNLLTRFRDISSSKKRRPNLVIDEFHNLPTRAADYYSPQLSEYAFSQIGERMETLPLLYAKEGSELLQRCLEILRSYRPPQGQGVVQLQAEDFIHHEVKISDFVGRYLQTPLELVKQDPVLRMSQLWSDFTAALSFLSENFFVTYQEDRRSGCLLKVTCCDASPMLRETYASFAHVVGFSATVKPFDYYAKLSGLGPLQLHTAEFTSPFPRENRKILVIPQVSTKYSDRQRNYQKIATAIERITDIRHGNYFVFFPSFQFLREVESRTQLPWARILVQTPEMKAFHVKSYISALKESATPTVIFAVSGGVFAEGVDYPGEMIIGALVVGPALPTFDLERELLKEYYEKHHGHGFDYAYTYPAMTKVIQAAGRVIRSERERGLIVLIDQRFIQPSYTKAMPQGWFVENVNELVSKSITKEIQEFWMGGADDPR